MSRPESHRADERMPADYKEMTAPGWARELIGLTGETAEPGFRRGLLQHLESTDYIPDPEWSEALAVMERGAGRESHDFRLTAFHIATRSHLREQAGSFADRFFSLAPPARRKAWQRLSAVVQYDPPLRLWLTTLARGLDVPCDAFRCDDEDAAVLARAVRDSFAQFPQRRAEMARAWQYDSQKDPDRWQNAALRLRMTAPRIASLDPHLIGRFAEQSSETQRRRRIPISYRIRTRISHDLAVLWRMLGAGGVAVASVLIISIFAIQIYVGLSTRSSAGPNWPPARQGVPELTSDQKLLIEEFLQRNARNGNRISEQSTEPASPRHDDPATRPAADPLNDPSVRTGMKAYELIQEIRRRQQSKIKVDPRKSILPGTRSDHVIRPGTSE